ncbi:putative uncharacterized protein DDB_G0294196 [Sitophilus oryzae]|uniref:Uncharacterized protein n=1 Tax=Sitophilus oryzae TaxID=7048 RepID=A0A6J2XMW7_SITOR|nr:putative uncharacterized protein DDB_G0294196 [Sitophilus oryzae]
MNKRLLIGISIIAFTAAYPQDSQNAAAPSVAPPSSPLIGVRFSAAPDVSHISFNSPLVSYGSSLAEIQLPAAPIEPANLKQAAGQSEYHEDQQQDADNQAQQQLQIQQSNLQNSQLIQSGQPQVAQPMRQIPQPQVQANPQFLSIQQYPSNLQLRASSSAQPQQIIISQTLPGPQPQTYTPNVYSQSTPQQPQYNPQFTYPQNTVPQNYPTNINPYFGQQYPAAADPNQYAGQQPVASFPAQSVPASYPATPARTNTYFATGPFAAPQPVTPAQYTPNQYAPIQYAPQGLQVGYPGNANGALVSRVTFNAPGTGFTYGF